MEELQESRTVDAPIQTCWDVLTDADLGSQWLVFADEVQTEGERGLGQKLIAKGSLLGVPLHATSEIDRFEEPHAFGWSGEQPFPTHFRFDLTEIDEDTTRVDSTIQLDPGKFFPVGKRMVMRAVQKQASKSADRLKALTEERARG